MDPFPWLHHMVSTHTRDALLCVWCVSLARRLVGAVAVCESNALCLSAIICSWYDKDIACSMTYTEFCLHTCTTAKESFYEASAWLGYVFLFFSDHVSWYSQGWVMICASRGQGGSCFPLFVSKANIWFLKQESYDSLFLVFISRNHLKNNISKRTMGAALVLT